MQMTRRYPFVYRRPRNLDGLGFDPFSTAAALASSFLSPSGGGGGGGGPAAGPGTPVGSTTVSPVIQTAISPQISPVFQQAFQPTNAPMTAGTTQTAPSSQSATTGQPSGFGPLIPGAGDSGLPIPGAGMPGDLFNTGGPSTPGGIPSGVYSQVPQQSFMSKYGLYIALAAGGLLVLAMAKKRKKAA